MTDKNFKQEACQVYIEQEIDDRLKDGMKPGEISRELTKEVNKLFEATVKPATIKKRVQRAQSDVGTNVPTPTSPNETSDDSEVEIEETSVSPVTQTPVPGKMRRRTLRLPPELDKSIIEYQDKYELKQADAFVQLLERGLKKQDAAVASALREELNYINKEVAEPMGLPTAEAIHIIVEYYLYKVKQEAEQKRTRNPIDGLLE